MHVIGVDIGATKVNVLRIDEHGTTISRIMQPHHADAGGDWLRCAMELVHDSIAQALDAEAGVRAIGISVAGLVDTRRGVLVDGGLLLARDVPMVSEFEETFGLPTAIENDANATLISALEHHDGLGTEATSLLFALGTGVGGAVGIGHSVLYGSFGYGGELGHIPVAPPDGRTCVCGSSGCLELHAGGRAVEQRARADAREGKAVTLLSRAGKPWEELTTTDVVHAAKSGEPYARALLESVGEAIGQAVVGLGPAIDPAVVFISGGFGHAAADMIMPAIERRLRLQHVYPEARPMPVIRRDPLGPDAAAIGAGLLARHRLHRDQDD